MTVETVDISNVPCPYPLASVCMTRLDTSNVCLSSQLESDMRGFVSFFAASAQRR